MEIGFHFKFIDKSTSKCLPDDVKCKKAEDKAAFDALEAKKLAEKGKYKPPELRIKKDSTGKLVCTMDGFVKMVKEFTEVSFILIALGKEALIGMIPDNFKRALKFAWDGTVGIGNWMGFLVASLYYLMEYATIGQETCDVFGYGYWLIDEMYALVDLVDKGKKTDVDISKVSSAAAKEKAARASLTVMKGAERTEAFKNMAIIEKAVEGGKVGTPDFLETVRTRVVETYNAHSAAIKKAAAASAKALAEAKAAAAATTPAAKPAAKTADAKKTDGTAAKKTDGTAAKTDGTAAKKTDGTATAAKK